MQVFMLLFLLIPLSVGGETSLKNVAFVILSQENDFHSQIASDLKNNLRSQFKNESPVIFLTHKDFSHIGSWTIFPLLLNISRMQLPNIYWMIFLEDYTGVNLEILHETLNKYDYNEKLWIGNELYDEEATIIHHYSFHKNPVFFKYPNIPSGFAMSHTMLESLTGRLQDNAHFPDFNIDMSHELALYIWQEGKGKMLTHDDSFCIRKTPQCATFVNPYTNHDKAVPNKSIFFAVKTCEKFHKERIPVVKKTWGKVAKNIKFFSNVEDESVPTIDLGIPNTDKGHCEKTMAILKYVDEEIRHNRLRISWVVVVDDDTIFSVSRLQQLLPHYNDSQDIALGERYGYNVAHTPPKGYNYLTGGGGMVFSVLLVKKLITNCKCPTLDAPDDMIIGLCLASLKIPIIHSPAFHQARPVDYSKKYLQNQVPVSFHKHWMIDPIKVYEKWFATSDANLSSEDYKHYEL